MFTNFIWELIPFTYNGRSSFHCRRMVIPCWHSGRLLKRGVVAPESTQIAPGDTPSRACWAEARSNRCCLAAGFTCLRRAALDFGSPFEVLDAGFACLRRTTLIFGRPLEVLDLGFAGTV